MNYLVPLIAFALVVYSRGASLPETPDNTIVLDVAKGDKDDPRAGRAEDQGEPFEIIVPVARNFSSLAELFRILKEDDSNVQEPKEARVAGTPPSYVKGTEQKASDFLIFFTDGKA